jgi:hypothetical protein
LRELGWFFYFEVNGVDSTALYLKTAKYNKHYIVKGKKE